MADQDDPPLKRTPGAKTVDGETFKFDGKVCVSSVHPGTHYRNRISQPSAGLAVAEEQAPPRRTVWSVSDPFCFATASWIAISSLSTETLISPPKSSIVCSPSAFEKRSVLVRKISRGVAALERDSDCLTYLSDTAGSDAGLQAPIIEISISPPPSSRPRPPPPPPYLFQLEVRCGVEMSSLSWARLQLVNSSVGSCVEASLSALLASLPPVDVSTEASGSRLLSNVA